jgi:hypothetical protein
MRGKALDLKAKILDRLTHQVGMVWTPVDFLDLAPRASVDKALQRLALAGQLRRIDRGLYDRPRLNALTGDLTVPDHRAVIEAIARRDQARILIDGLTAANDLGLTTAVPAQITVLTDVHPRPVTLGNLCIRFKTVAPSRLYWAGRPAMRVVQALHWFKDTLPGDRSYLQGRLATLLTHPVHAPPLRMDLANGLYTLPIWMQSIVREALLATSSPQEATA